MKNITRIMSAALLITLACASMALALTSTATVAVADGNNQFALALYQRLSGSEGNLFFSPYSISSALAMTYAGARGQTAREMAQAMRFTLDPAELHPAFGALQQRLNDVQKSGHVQLSIANSLWVQNGYPFLDDFLTLAKTNYAAEPYPVDFRTNAEGARVTINAWVADKTNDKIQNLIGPGVLTRLTEMVLCNAVYFKGLWADQFKKEQTKDNDFHVNAAKTVKVPLMEKTANYRYLKSEGFSALEMPYQGNELSMVVLLPDTVDGIPELESKLTPENFNSWMGRLSKRPARVDVFLPKFKTTEQFSLNKTLAAMGMGSAFDKDAADFSGMDGKKCCSANCDCLYIGQVIHKAFVAVDEQGTEAAAATAVVMVRASIAMREPDPVIFRADHPFIFLIRDNATGSILFLGRITDPAKE